MRVIGVLDLRGGQAVHARRGEREAYAPLGNGDAPALARTYVRDRGVRELYVADLDAILGGARQSDLVSRICAIGAPVWLDAGVSSIPGAQAALETGAARVVVGLETLTSYDALAAICDEVGGQRVAFSLDLRNGVPMGTCAAGEPVERIAARAAAAGAAAMIVIDLARVGADTGLDLELIARVRDAVPDRMLLAGGGVRGVADLDALGHAGCDGVLVATALHTGRLGAAAIEAARHFRVRR